MSKNIVFEGWLTKSPPSKRIWRTKWRRRWFALRQSGELPGQYFLDYYADRNCRRLKGTINLDLCEQVDAGLHMERTGNGNLDPKLRGSVFTIQTQSRTYHLEADCEADMEKWVDAICRVCGLRATDESSEETGTFPSNLGPIPTITREPTPLDSTGPYIPISECITGVRAQDSQRAFTFDPKNIITSMNSQNQLYASQPQVRLANPELSENDSNPSDEECKSLNNSQHNIRDYSVAKTFTKMTLNESPHKNGESEDGPPVPPRPPKTFAMSKEKCQKEPVSTPKSPEKLEAQDQNMSLRVPRRLSQVGATPPSPVKALVSANPMRVTPDDEDDTPCPQYWNLSMPPAVDRALKPRSSSYSVGSPSIPMTQALPLPPRAPVKSILKTTQPKQEIQETSFTTNNDDVPLPLPPRCPVVRFTLKITPPDDAVEVPKELPLPLPPRCPRVRPVVQKPPPVVAIRESTSCYCIDNAMKRAHFTPSDEIRPDTLQYLDLDLMPQSDSKDGIKKPRDIRRKVEIAHGKSFSAADADCAYKTVDFLKTEAFNITRKDAEASRNNY